MGSDAGSRDGHPRTLRLPLTVCLALLLSGAVIGVGGALAAHHYVQTSRIVFDATASVFTRMIPIGKITALAYVLFTVQRGSAVSNRQRTKLYRVVEFIGRWSMKASRSPCQWAATVLSNPFAPISLMPPSRQFATPQ